VAEPWTSLIPLALAGAMVPAQIVVTVLLLRTPGGVAKGAAFIGGMTVVRLTQGLLFGVLLSGADSIGGGDGPGTIGSVLLLVLGVVLLVTAGRSLLTEEDPDAPPPKWLAMTDSLTWPHSLALGVGFIAASPKFWVFTLGAIAVIEEAEPAAGAGAIAFLVFVALSQAVLLTLLVARAAAPRWSAGMLEAISGWLARHNQALVVLIGLVFGTWFALKGLSGLGVF